MIQTKEGLKLNKNDNFVIIEEDSINSLTDYQLVEKYKNCKRQDKKNMILSKLNEKYKPGISHLAYKMKMRLNKDNSVAVEDCEQDIFIAMYKAVEYIDINKIYCKKENFNFFGILEKYAYAEIQWRKKKLSKAEVQSLYFGVDDCYTNYIPAKRDDSYILDSIWEEIKKEFVKNLNRKERAIFNAMNRKEEKQKVAKRLNISSAIVTYKLKKINTSLKELVDKKLNEIVYS